MSESLYSKMEHAQYMGPSTSDNYNIRVENAYKDLVYLMNKVSLADEDLKTRFRNVVKEHLSLVSTIDELETRIIALENTSPNEKYRLLTFFDSALDDSNTFSGTSFAVSNGAKCSLDTRHGVVTLPKSSSSSASRLGYIDNDGNFILPSGLEMIESGISGTADSALNNTKIIKSNVYNSVLDEPGKVWERSVVTDSQNITNGAAVNLYVRVPETLSVTNQANALVVHPFPFAGSNLLGVYTSGQQDINLNDSDSYIAVNSNKNYEDDTSAVGWSAPGSWSEGNPLYRADAIYNCGPKIFYFDPKQVNAIKIALGQKQSFYEKNKYIYSYGLSFLDLRYEDFLSTGKIIFKFSPTGKTISRVDKVTPNIYNVPESQINDVFSYRVIWNNGGTYTLSPAPFSNSIWIEVTLNKTIGGGTPSLSGLKVEYS